MERLSAPHLGRQGGAALAPCHQHIARFQVVVSEAHRVDVGHALGHTDGQPVQGFNVHHPAGVLTPAPSDLQGGT
jgi:hypothetical protein